MPHGAAQDNPDLFRGVLHQTYSILLYMLVRRLDYPELQVVVESKEDAVFTYLLPGNRTVIELVQCKKKEDEGSADIHAGWGRGEIWRAGEFTFGELKSWMTTPRHGYVAEQFLTANPNSYYTALLFGTLNPKLASFLTGFPGALRCPSEAFSKGFPVDHLHPGDPSRTTVASRTFGPSEDVRRRTRVLLVDSPTAVEIQCRAILENSYEVSGNNSARVVDNLATLLLRRQSASDRLVLNRDLEPLIAAGRRAPGKWIVATSPEYLDQGNAVSGKLDRAEHLRWLDFENNRYGHRQAFDDAWGLLQENPVIVCGPLGTGKTTLCRYLAYRHLTQKNTHTSYYLAVRPSDSLDDEIRYMEQCITTDALFIVDDEHLSRSAVERLVTRFRNFFDLNKARAKLVISSVITYSRGQAMSHGQTMSPLNQMAPIQLSAAEYRAEVRSILTALQASGQLDAVITIEQLERLSRRNIGLALILARCARHLEKEHAVRWLRDTRYIPEMAKNWVLDSLGAPGDDHLYQQVLRAFVLGSFMLPVPGDFVPRVCERLQIAGLLVEDTSHLGLDTYYHVTDPQLATVATPHHGPNEHDFQLEVLSEYVSRHPEMLLAVCERLAEPAAPDRDWCRSLLRGICRTNSSQILDVLKGEGAFLKHQLRALDLDACSRILRSIYLVAREESRRLMQALIAPYGEPSLNFFSNVLLAERITTPYSIVSFFDTLSRICDYEFRALAQAQLKSDQVDFFLARLELFPLEGIAACLQAIARCSQPFAQELLNRLEKTPTFVEKLHRADDNEFRVFIWVQFCERLKTVRRTAALGYLEHHLTASDVTSAVLSGSDLYRWYVYLLRLRRLHPRLAADVAAVLTQQHLSSLLNMLNRECDLQGLTGGALYTLSRLNRGQAVKVARDVRPHIQNLLSAERRYHKVGAALNAVAKHIDYNLAVDMGDMIDQAGVRDSLLAEDRRINLIGKFLMDLHEIRPDLAERFEREVEERYSELGESITRNPLLHWVRLIRGLLISAPPERKLPLLNRLVHDKAIKRDLRRGWQEAVNLSEIAFCLDQLLDTPINQNDILTLLDFDSCGDFESNVSAKFEVEESVLHIANGLWAIARFDGALALKDLQRYVTRVEARRQERQETGPPQWILKQGRKRQIARGFESATLAELGCLLRISAAIDIECGHRLASMIDLRGLADQINSQPNLARVAEFLTGLGQASRWVFLNLLPLVSDVHTLQQQMDENEDIQNLVYYSIAVGQVSRNKYVEYTRLALEHLGPDIQEAAKIEANLMLIAN